MTFVLFHALSGIPYTKDNNRQAVFRSDNLTITLAIRDVWHTINNRIIAKYNAKQRYDLTDISRGSLAIIVAPKNFCAFFVRMCDNCPIVAIFVALSHVAT